FIANAVVDADQDVLSALIRARDEWNSVSLSDFEFASPGFSDFAPIYFPEALPLGPVDARLDRYNTITFFDPNFAPADGVIYVPIVFYFNRDFDTDEGFVIPPDIINPSSYIVDELDDAILVEREQDLQFVLPFDDYKGGTIVR